MKKKYHKCSTRATCSKSHAYFQTQRTGSQKLGWGDIWAWLAGIVLVYAFLFGSGKIVFGDDLIGLLYFGIAALSGFVIYRHFTKSGWETLTD